MDGRDQKVKYCFKYGQKDKQQGQNGYYIASLPKNNVFYCQRSVELQPVMASWIEAWQTCGMEGGTLPLLRSRQEMHELIALLKLSPHIGDEHYSLKLQAAFYSANPEILQSIIFTPSPENIQFIFIGLAENQVR